MITIAIAAVALGVAVLALRPRRPVVFVRNPIVDMGTILQRTKGRMSWLVENRGSVPLRIWVVRATEGIRFPPELKGGTITVPPGGSTNLSFGWIIHNTLGRYRRAVTLGTNDPDQPELGLSAELAVAPRDSSDKEYVGSFEIDQKSDATR
jgi:hypothetical protein